MTKKVIALLPMKANSERVKGKNFRMFAGKPLFQWILDALLEVEAIDKVLINTDAKDILLENGLVESDRVDIKERKPELQGDMVSMNLILQDDVATHEADTYIMTHTTNPLITGETITKALELYDQSDDCDSVFTVNPVQTRFYKEDMTPINHNPAELIRTQDLETWYEENSCLYIFSAESFAKTDARIGETPKMFPTPKIESVDIDEVEDWYMAEALAIYKQQN